MTETACAAPAATDVVHVETSFTETVTYQQTFTVDRGRVAAHFAVNPQEVTARMLAQWMNENGDAWVDDVDFDDPFAVSERVVTALRFSGDPHP